MSRHTTTVALTLAAAACGGSVNLDLGPPPADDPTLSPAPAAPTPRGFALPCRVDLAWAEDHGSAWEPRSRWVPVAGEGFHALLPQSGTDGVLVQRWLPPAAPEVATAFADYRVGLYAQPRWLGVARWTDTEIQYGPRGAIVDAWVRAAPEARLLVTSRAPLGLPAEHIVSLEPLDLEAAVALLSTRALSVAPTAAPTDEQARAIVAAVDRLPLAIELAASRQRLLTPAELLQRLGRPLEVLRGPRTDARHGSMRRAVLDSVGLLSAAHARLFALASVCRTASAPTTPRRCWTGSWRRSARCSTRFGPRRCCAPTRRARWRATASSRRCERSPASSPPPIALRELFGSGVAVTQRVEHLQGERDVVTVLHVGEAGEVGAGHPLP